MKRKKILTLWVAVFFSMFTTLGYVTSKAAIRQAVPKLRVVTNPKTEYKVGDRITFKVTSPNYGGAVEYRVILWNGNTKTQKELWPNMPGYYYQKWKPLGNCEFPITWIVTKDMEPGPYRLTVLTRRAGAKVTYDSFVELPVFWVKTDTSNNTNNNTGTNTPSNNDVPFRVESVN
jgi:hypothetical protein